MINHRDCFHSSTPSARRGCRQVQEAMSLAHELGLQVEVHTEEGIQDIRIRKVEDRWFDTSLQVLLSASGRTTLILYRFSKIEKEPIGHLPSWIKTISI